MTDQVDKLIRKYLVPKKELTENEKIVLGKLEDAAELTANIYKLQVNDRFLGANFYPHDTSREEILKNVEDNPLILNPYTVVTRGEEGQLEAIPYHIQYAKELKPVVALLREAAQVTQNKEFSKRLEVQADALENGSYEAADIYWLSMPPYIIDIIIGPVERYEDRLFYKKTCYSATVGIMDKQATDEALEIRDAMLSSTKKGFSLSQRVEVANRLKVRVDRISVLAGLDARARFTAANLPNDPYLVEKYGSEVIIFATEIEEKFKDIHHPIFKKLFEINFQKSYEPELLIEGSLKLLLVREISSGLIRYKDAEARLGELYPVIDEMASYVLAIKSAGILLLKDLIPQKLLEAMIIMFLCRAATSVTRSENVKSLTHYSQGYAIVINYFLQSGALREHQGISWVNFTKIFVALNDLATSLEKILAFGDIEDARRLINEYGDTQTLLKLSRRM